tara:strand:- start:5021 stop:5155 length:135 start_codon:yes stop_codon:yes gene_type:complete
MTSNEEKGTRITEGVVPFNRPKTPRKAEITQEKPPKPVRNKKKK